jgi:MFS transporter, PPP family, 3-phenylpropionic acid transporter
VSRLPYRRLAGFYFFYFAYIGSFAPFFSLYLEASGHPAVAIGILMSLPSVTRIIAPHLWGWLADRSGRGLHIVRLTGVAGLACFLGVFAGSGFALLFGVLFAMTFFWSAALPLVEAATLTHLGEDTGRYGRIRLWGSVGFIVAVVGVGYALDLVSVLHLPWIVAATMVGMLGFCWNIPERPPRHTTTERGIAQILRRPEVLALIGAGALMSAAHGPYYTFYSLYLVDHGYSKAVTGWLWALGVLCEIGVFLGMPHLYRSYTARQILLASFALAIVRFLLIGWAIDTLVLLLLAQTLHAATFGSFHAAAIGLVHRLFQGRHQARGQAIYGSLSFGVGGMAGALASGYSWQHLGPQLSYTWAAGCALAGFLLLWWKLHLPAGQSGREKMAAASRSV